MGSPDSPQWSVRTGLRFCPPHLSGTAGRAPHACGPGAGGAGAARCRSRAAVRERRGQLKDAGAAAVSLMVLLLLQAVALAVTSTNSQIAACREQTLDDRTSLPNFLWYSSCAGRRGSSQGKRSRRGTEPRAVRAERHRPHQTACRLSALLCSSSCLGSTFQSRACPPAVLPRPCATFCTMLSRGSPPAPGPAPVRALRCRPRWASIDFSRAVGVWKECTCSHPLGVTVTATVLCFALSFWYFGEFDGGYRWLKEYCSKPLKQPSKAKCKGTLFLTAWQMWVFCLLFSHTIYLMTIRTPAPLQICYEKYKYLHALLL